MKRREIETPHRLLGNIRSCPLHISLGRSVLDAHELALKDSKGDVDMSKPTRNSGKHWTPQQDAQLRELARQNTPTRVIGLKTGRTAAAVSSRASSLGVSLKPTNQSPYGRRR
jgi:hypothetical protein